MDTEKIFNYPEDCKSKTVELSDLDEDIQKELQTDGSCKRIYHRLSIYGSSEDSCRQLGLEVHEYFVYTRDNIYVQVIYQVFDRSEEKIMERMVKLNRPFDYIASHKEEISETKFHRLAPCLKRMLDQSDDYQSVEIYKGCCYYAVIPSQSSFSSEELEKWNHTYMEIRKEAFKLASNHLHQKGFMCMYQGEQHPEFYFYDNLPLYEQNLNDLHLEEDERDDILKEGEYNYLINLYSQKGEDGFESLNLLEDPFSLEDNRVFCSTVFFWENSVNEWACGFADTLDVLMEYESQIDEYDLEKKAPTLFKALYNATRRQTDKGALFLFPGKSFFICQYSAALSEEEQSQLFENCRNTVYRLQEEAGLYIRHLKLCENKETRKNSKANDGFFQRMFGMKLLQDIIDGLKYI